jgi:hypothetical protein
MSRFETQSSSIELDAVTDDVNKTEPFPEKSLPNTCLEVVEVIDGRPSVKIGSLLCEDTTHSEGKIGFSTR